jgi:polyvinyl alcohol dehydrogenase (cytochrome)
MRHLISSCAFLLITQSFASLAAQPPADLANAKPENSIQPGTTSSTDIPMEKGGPYDRVYYPENLPSEEDAKHFPSTWEFLGSNPQHNAAFNLPADAPSWLMDGAEWKFAEARSWPLDRKDSFDNSVYGARRGPSTQTQFYGNAVGVSIANGIVYAESDDQFAYAVNAKTGKLIWRTSPVGNTLMGTPIVAEGMVFLSAGNVGFNFSNVSKFAKTKTAVRGEGISFNGIYALSAKTGELLWHFPTKGEAMPTAAYSNGKIYITTGDGYAQAVDTKTGNLVWKTELKGMANMSSPAIVDGKIYVAMSSPGGVFCLDETNGHVVWKSTIKGAEDTGIGDVSPAVSNGIVVMDAVADQKQEKGKTTMDTRIVSFDANTGKKLWQANMGRGAKPPAFKGGVPMIHDGVVYVGTPVNNVIQAYDHKSGKLRWTWQVPDASAAGSGRGAPTYYQGSLYVATAEYLYTLNPSSGTLIHKYHVGGRFGIVNPVIIGGTVYLSNSWDWLMAIPLSRINPKVQRGMSVGKVSLSLPAKRSHVTYASAGRIHTTYR